MLQVPIFVKFPEQLFARNYLELSLTSSVTVTCLTVN